MSNNQRQLIDETVHRIQDPRSQVSGIIDDNLMSVQNQEQVREKKALTKGKKKKNVASKKKQQPEEQKKTRHKKWIFFVIVITAFGLYYMMSQYLRPKQIEEQKKTIKEGEILFDTSISQKYSFIKQRVDHFGTNKKHFAQKVILNIDQEKVTQDTPIFLSLPPLTPATSPQKAVNIKSISSKLNAIQIALEPRYFGSSLPFGFRDSFLLDNLQYLSIEQMIEDIAYVIDRIVQKEFFNITYKNPWILTGESHSAIIAVWFKAVYPDVVRGVYASSPIQPALLAPKISQKLYSNAMSGGKTCRAVLQALMKDLQKNAYGDTKEGFLLDMGLGVTLSSEQAQYLLMSRLRIINRNDFITTCSQNDQEQLFKMFKSAFIGKVYKDSDPLAFSSLELAAAEEWEYFGIVRQSRALNWLKCQQLGLFQTAAVNQRHSLNYQQMNETFFRKRCETIFAKGVWPQTEALNGYFEGDLRRLKDVFIVHGYYDIWLPYAYLPRNTTTVSTNIVKCSFCGHNFDTLSNSRLFKTVDQVKEREEQTIKKWVSRRRRNV